ncbi:hypothetical protein CQ018_07235 [Arthrobacter sp. MYb227]|uniref:DUF4232 domain-containing protein n=1 Tax=Arthrobacter sp. MYb227 TaxID=1848601 RepID=UPI000CFCF042|nr:DUF4232 domain-containing protein [Arthrobacter sp. MYb227]PQZ95106.1 hypothetical protein CQ018_07235 [Arthrobacter sp. MYb227]
MEKEERTAGPALRITAISGLIWLLTGVLNGLILSSQTRIPAQFTRLFFPESIALRTWQSTQPWPILLTLFSVLTLMAFTFLLLRTAGLRSAKESTTFPGFLATWMCIILAAFGTAAFVSLGFVFASWPPARLAWLLEGVQPALFNAGYWGILWGWIPALAGSWVTARVAASDPVAPKPAPKQRDGLPVALAVLLALTLTAAVPAAHYYTQNAQAGAVISTTPAEPVPTPTPYGWADRSDAFQEAGENWCTGDAVSISVGEPEGATGHRGMGIVVTNTATQPCVLQSYPDIVFNNADGWAIEVMVVHGGSFMTDDPGVSEIPLAPGASAQAFIGWNAMAAAGDIRTGEILVAPFAGTLRHSSAVDLDIVDGGTVSVTAWQALEAPGAS